MNREIGDIYVPRAVPVGTKIWFSSERHGYTVRASNTAFAILTKPFNAQKTVLYTIIDWELGIRGPSNLIWGTGAETDEECLELLDMLTSGEIEVSHRRCVKLDISRGKIDLQSWRKGRPMIYEAKDAL
jgi:hypothetical protein|nr:MAG TPA: hypothetical protein [Caudoviricetes sp.]